MASRALGYRKLPGRGIPWFMGRSSVLAKPSRELRAASRNVFFAKSASFTEQFVGGVQPVVLTQQGGQWCWAAVSQALLALEHVSKTQQAIVSLHTGSSCQIMPGGLDLQASCTASVGCAIPCDQPHSLVRAMEGLQYPVSRKFEPDLSQVKAALADRPVAAQVQFDDGGGHMILITACSGAGSNPTIRYLCPIYSDWDPYPVQPQTESWNDFEGGFRLFGRIAFLSHIYPRQ